MLRVGIMLDGTQVARWKFEAVQRIRRAGHAEVALAIINSADGAHPSPLASKLSHAAFHGYQWMDRMLFPVKNDPFESVDIGPEITGAKVMRVTPEMTRFSDRFKPEDVAAIKNEKLDVLIRFGFRVLRGEILRSARYGVWSFHHGDNATHRGAPACFWEVADDHPTTGAIVQVLSEELDGGKTLARIWCSTNRLSYGRSRAELYWNCIQMLPQLIKRLDQEGSAMLEQNGATPQVQLYDRPLYKTPTNGKGMLAATRILSRSAAKMMRRAVLKEQWRLMYAVEPELGKTAVYRYKQLTPPKDRFWADPFVIKRENRFYIFIEELMYATERGHISVLTLDEKGSLVDGPRTAVRENYHLSYPYLFEFNGQLFMVPESCEDGSLWLYECADFPLVWKKKRALMKDVIAVDPTIFFHNDRWWMFVNMAERRDTAKHTHLHLFHATDPTSGEWVPHPKNPVVSDARRARPAGKPFIHHGNLYRPSQDCAGSYGRGIRINRVLTLDAKDYQEAEDSYIQPRLNSNQIGIHTLNRCENLTVVDALFQVPHFI